jgi:hypothetical protein
MYTHAVLVSILAALATASPVEVRQIGGTGTTSNEFSEGGCKEILFAWARGSTEIGNMVSIRTLNTCVQNLIITGHCCWPTHLGWVEGSLWP